MPFAPKANPDLAGIMMAQGISKLGEALGGAASAGMKAYGSEVQAKGTKKALVTGGLPQGGGNEELTELLRSYGLTDEQITELMQAQGGQFGMGPGDFGL